MDIKPNSKNEYKEVTKLLENYYVGESAKVLYDFIWGEFCDWYIEISKGTLYDEKAGELRKKSVKYILWEVSSIILRLLHPFMPFITEELWQHLPATSESIVIAPWPKVDESLIDEDAERRMTYIMETIRSIRNLRAEMDIQPGKKVRVIIKPYDAEYEDLIQANKDHIIRLSTLSELQISWDFQRSRGCAVGVIDKAEIFMPLGEIMDIEKESLRLKRELIEIEKEIEKNK